MGDIGGAVLALLNFAAFGLGFVVAIIAAAVLSLFVPVNMWVALASALVVATGAAVWAWAWLK